MTKDEAMKQAKTLVTVLLADDVISKQEAEILRQAIEQAESKSASDCDSPSWCNQYGKCHRSVIGAPMLANCIQGQEPVAFLMDGELFTIAEYEVIAEQGDGAQPLYTAPPKREQAAEERYRYIT